MEFLVTGSAGFIGSNVSALLLERGDTVVGVDNLCDYYSPRLKQWRLERLVDYKNFHFVQADIAHRQDMERLFEEHSFNAVINLAARAGVRGSIENPWIYYESNVLGTLQLLECCKKQGVKQFLLASSSSVYGNNQVPFRENDFTDLALSPYAASKKAGEVLCHSYYHLCGLNIAIPRFFTVYGPAGRPDMGYLKFIDRIAKGQQIEVYGDGTQLRDFTYVDDIAEGVVRALELKGYEVFNLGGSNPVELNQVISIIESLLGKRARITRAGKHPADASVTWASNKKAMDLLGWKAKTSVQEGLRQTVDWYLASPGLF